MTMFNLNPGFAIRALQGHQAAVTKSLERLATGKQINRASDDPAGMMAADSMMFNIRRIEKTLEAGQMAQYFVGAADGGLTDVTSKLLNLKGLIVNAANSGGMSKQGRNDLQDDADEILKGISHTTNTLVFRGRRLLAEGFAVTVGETGVSMSGISLTSLGVVSREPDPEEGEPGSQPASGPPNGGHVPLDPSEDERFSIANIASGQSLNLLSGDLEMAAKSVDAAISELAIKRAEMGAALRGVEAEMGVWNAEFESLTGAHSDLMDLDYAKETSQLVRAQLMRDAAVSAVVIGRENAERSLDLLLDSAKIVIDAEPIEVPSTNN